MPNHMLPLILRNLRRSKIRLIATLGGCTVAAVIVCFFLAADTSMKNMLSRAEAGNNLVVTQQDRY